MLKTIEKAIFVGFLLTALISMTNFSGRCDGISDKILRFHILANSDSKEDQDLKLKVRDRILNYCSPYFKDNVVDKQAAEDVIKAHIDGIKSEAEDEIRINGYDYPVNIIFTDMYFGTRKYKNTTIPSGKYRAMRVIIGDGNGHNWWCVMFPPMCLPAAQEREELSGILDSNEMDVVDNECGYEVKFKVLEIFNCIKDLISNML